MPTSFSPLLFYKDKDLLSALEQHGTPLPMSLSTLRKDRLDGRAGGIPYRKNGGTILYSPAEVLEFIYNLPKFQGHSNKLKPVNKTKPTKQESVSAQRAGISVGELRAIRSKKNG